MKDDELNNNIVEKDSDGLMHALWNKCNKEFKILLKNGNEVDATEYHFQMRISIDNDGRIFRNVGYPNYSTIPIYVSCLRWKNYYKNPQAINQIITDNFERAVLYLTLPDQTEKMKLTFKFETECTPTFDTYEYGKMIDSMIISITPEYDTINRIPYKWSSSYEKEGKHVNLYLRKDLVDPIEEVNWDGITNPFQYIIQQQFYEISPNPNAATTLYTDFNITSSKIITADNITTMRSDLNVLTNNFDVVSYDVKDITAKVDTLRGEMASQIEKTKYLKAETDKLEVISGIALGFAVAGSVLSVGTSFSASGITFGTQIKGGNTQGLGSIRGTVSTLTDEAIEGLLLEEILAPMIRTITVDLSPVLNWCDSSYSDIIIPYDENDEFDDPEARAMTLQGLMVLCNRFRDSLKPVFKTICQKVEEVASDLEFNGEHITEINNKYDALFSKCIIYDELVRDDTIDVITKIENNNIILEAEDEINTGLIVLLIYVGDKSQWRRRVYIKIEEKVITEYKGIQVETTLNDIVFKPLARSEDDRANYFSDIILDGNSIVIEVQNEYKISGIIVDYNSLTRHMTFGVEDLAYTCDIVALDKKINALAETSHTNDALMASIQDTYATVDEVNEVLTHYVLKSEVINK